MAESALNFPGGILAPTRAPETTLEKRAWRALDGVIDPEIRQPVTTLGMVDGVYETKAGLTVDIRLTIAGCPLQNTITEDVTDALAGLVSAERVLVNLSPMTAEQRAEFTQRLQDSRPANPFGPDTMTRIYAVASGKGGVGKSSVTANLAAGFAAQGLEVGVIDADIHGFSIPGLFGTEAKPTKVEEMILPVVAHGVKIISIGMFLDVDQPVAWRGPMLHRALEQFITDVHWGDLDVLLIDLPPGTGDIAISAAQLLPTAEVLVVTTPQQAAAQVAIRAGQLSLQTEQPVAGVIENMGPMRMPDGSVMELFGSGGGQLTAEKLSEELGKPIPLLGSVPLDPVLRADGDAGTPTVVAHPESDAGRALAEILEQLNDEPRKLAGRKLPISPR